MERPKTPWNRRPSGRRLRRTTTVTLSQSSPSDVQATTNWGEAFWVLEGPDGEIKGFGHETNVITDYGDRVYAENGAGTTSPPAVPQTMALGTSSTPATKSGAGATLVTPLAGATASGANLTKAASAGTNARTITYVGTCGPGAGTTSTPITEAVLTNVAAGTTPAIGNTVSRLLFTTPVGTKGAQDTLTVTWLHNLGSPAT